MTGSRPRTAPPSFPIACSPVVTPDPRDADRRPLRPPRPVPVRAYRYSKLRWRLLVWMLDTVGGLAMKVWRKFRPARRILDPKRILILQLDHLGDAVLSSPMFPRLKQAWPEAVIEVLATPSNCEVFEANPLVDRVHLAGRSWFDRRPGRRALARAIWELGRSLKQGRYDLGIDVRGDVASVLVMALARIPRRLGWAMGGGGFLLTDVAEWVPMRHEVASRLALLNRVGVGEPAQTANPRQVKVHVHVSERERRHVATQLRKEIADRLTLERTVRPTSRQHDPTRWATSIPTGPNPTPALFKMAWPATLTENLRRNTSTPRWWSRFDERPLLAVHLGAGTEAKRWPPTHWRMLIDRFLEEGWRVVGLGGPEDQPLAQQVIPPPAHPHWHNWVGRLKLTETVALLELADLFIGSDSGPAHLAACAGVTSVVLFSGTNAIDQWRPWSPRVLALSHRVPCRPCHRKVCPLADHPCMNGMTPERVHHAAWRWWVRNLETREVSTS